MNELLPAAVGLGQRGGGSEDISQSICDRSNLLCARKSEAAAPGRAGCLAVRDHSMPSQGATHDGWAYR